MIYCGEENACQRDSISPTCRLITAHPSPLVHYLSVSHSFVITVSLGINHHFYTIDNLFDCFSLSFFLHPSIKPDISRSCNYSDDCRVKLVLLPTATFDLLGMSDELLNVIAILHGGHISHLASTSRLSQHFCIKHV